MAWSKKPINPIQFQSPVEFTEVEKSVSPSEGGSSRVTLEKVTSKDINKRQLDPKVVNLQSLIENNMTIDPGTVSKLLNTSDPASIEEFNSMYTQEAYKYLQEHESEIFVKNEGGEKKEVEKGV